MATNSQIPQMITAAAQAQGVSPSLALALAQEESGFNQSAISSTGAIGVMQLEPATAVDLGGNPFDLAQNINMGVKYLAQLLAQYGGDTAKALAAYNWGEGNVNSAVTSASSSGENWFSSIPSSVQSYVNKILNAAGLGSGSSTPSAAASAPVASSPAPSSGGDSLLYLSLAALGALFVADFVFGDA